MYGAELLFSTALAAFSILLISFLAGRLFSGILVGIAYGRQHPNDRDGRDQTQCQYGRLKSLPIASASIAAVAVMMIISKISERRGTCLG